MDASSGAIWGLVVVNVATLATVVIRGMFAAASDKRHRQYDVEDRAALAAKVEATASALALKVLASSTKVSEQLGDHDRWEHNERVLAAEGHAELREAIAQNTELTKDGVKAAGDAYHEANTVNLKLEKLGLEHNAIERVAATAKERHDDTR